MEMDLFQSQHCRYLQNSWYLMGYEPMLDKYPLQDWKMYLMIARFHPDLWYYYYCIRKNCNEYLNHQWYLTSLLHRFLLKKLESRCFCLLLNRQQVTVHDQKQSHCCISL